MLSTTIQLSVALVIAFHATCHAQSIPPAGYVYSEVNGNCPISSLAASATTGMIIYPVKDDATNTTAMNSARIAVETYLDNPSDKAFWNYTSDVDGVLIWYAYLNNGQACDIANLSSVSLSRIRSSNTSTNVSKIDFVKVDGPLDVDYDAPSDSAKRAETTLSTQTTAVTELRVISQPTNVSNVANLQNYVFDQTAGTGITVYIVESGVNSESSVSLHNHENIIESSMSIRSALRWLA